MTNVAAFTDEQQKRAISSIERFIKEPPDNSRVFTITPEMAQSLLDKYNLSNRSKKPAKIREYTQAMLACRWALTGDTLKFSSKGILRDGQNRLFACLMSGVPFRTHLVFGVDDEAFKYMDRGKNRDGADVLAIAGYKYTLSLANAVRWAELISTGREKTRASFEPQQVLDLVQTKYKSLPDFLPAADRIYVQTRQPRGLVAALLYLFHQASPAKEPPFSAAWGNGTVGGRFIPLLRLQTRTQALHTATSGRVHDVVRAAMIIKAWNLYVRGEKGRGDVSVAWSPMDDFPKIEA